jgi:hypothetical protein
MVKSNSEKVLTKRSKEKTISKILKPSEFVTSNNIKKKILTPTITKSNKNIEDPKIRIEKQVKTLKIKYEIGLKIRLKRATTKKLDKEIESIKRQLENFKLEKLPIEKKVQFLNNKYLTQLFEDIKQFCNRCHQRGHHENECNNEDICSWCQYYGHNKKECKLLKLNIEEKETKQNIYCFVCEKHTDHINCSNTTDNYESSCYICGENHWGKDCIYDDISKIVYNEEKIFKKKKEKKSEKKRFKNKQLKQKNYDNEKQIKRKRKK